MTEAWMVPATSAQRENSSVPLSLLQSKTVTGQDMQREEEVHSSQSQAAQVKCQQAEYIILLQNTVLKQVNTNNKAGTTTLVLDKVEFGLKGIK